MVDPSQAAEVKKYMESAAGSNITLDDNRVATLLKGDVKEKDNEAILIFRYQLIS
ncbi:MAG TPA: hypothetical protein VEB00_17240 [Clostridia bacterium]|nr:hypothetical protein [Clostridia bacterium]